MRKLLLAQLNSLILQTCAVAERFRTGDTSGANCKVVPVPGVSVHPPGAVLACKANAFHALAYNDSYMTLKALALAGVISPVRR